MTVAESICSRITSDQDAEESKECMTGKWKTDIIEEILAMKAELRAQPYFFLFANNTV